MTQKELSSKEAQQRELQTDGLIERIFGCAPGTPRKMPTTPAEWREDILQRTRAQIGMMAERGDEVSKALIPHTVTHLANMMTHLGRDMEHDKQLEELSKKLDEKLPQQAKGNNSEEYRKYPKDAEALILLKAAAKKLATLRKKSPKTTHAEAIRVVLEEPDGSETKKQKEQRREYQCRVWHGAVKNGTRKNATALPPERLDPKAKTAAWRKIYMNWGKALSAYLKHPPAK